MSSRNGIRKRPVAAKRQVASNKSRKTPPVPTCTLANNVTVPMVGFGTAFFADGVRRPEISYHAVNRALEAGYRHIDTASMYGCERHVGNVIGHWFMKGDLVREDLFITTKVGHPPTDDFPNASTHYVYDPELSAYQGVMDEFHQSLSDLGVGYVDMILIHWPGMFIAPDRWTTDWKPPAVSKDLARQKRREMWEALEKLYDMKLTRAIGVSNFTIDHLEELMPACRIKPMMNQLEVHPYLQQALAVDFCHRHSIRVTAYSPLAGGKVKVVEDDFIKGLAKAKKVTPSQIILSWLSQRGIVVIPKSSNPGRMTENLRVDRHLLSDFEMKLLGDLNRDLHTCPDPSKIL